jgi:hypothetical protein
MAPPRNSVASARDVGAARCCGSGDALVLILVRWARCSRACRSERWSTPDGVDVALEAREGSGCNRTSVAALAALSSSAAPSVVLWVEVGHCVVVVGGVRVRVLGSEQFQTVTTLYLIVSCRCKANGP